MTILVLACSALASLALVFLMVRRLPVRWPWLAGAPVAWTLGAQVLDRTILPGAYSDLEPRVANIWPKVDAWRYGLRGNTPEADALLAAPFTDGHARVAYDELPVFLYSRGGPRMEHLVAVRASVAVPAMETGRCRMRPSRSPRGGAVSAESVGRLAMTAGSRLHARGAAAGARHPRRAPTRSRRRGAEAGSPEALATWCAAIRVRLAHVPPFGRCPSQGWLDPCRGPLRATGPP